MVHINKYLIVILCIHIIYISYYKHTYCCKNGIIDKKNNTFLFVLLLFLILHTHSQCILKCYRYQLLLKQNYQFSNLVN